MADPITPDVFRENFPEFANDTSYPDAQVQFWLDVAYKRLPACKWDDLLDLGAQLYTAHNLTLERQAGKAAASGGVPGINSGPINSKSVDKASAGYDSAVASIEGAGNYNITTYGTRFYELMLIVGAGAIQVGTGYGQGGPIPFSPWVF